MKKENLNKRYNFMLDVLDYTNEDAAEIMKMKGGSLRNKVCAASEEKGTFPRYLRLPIAVFEKMYLMLKQKDVEMEGNALFEVIRKLRVENDELKRRLDIK